MEKPSIIIFWSSGCFNNYPPTSQAELDWVTNRARSSQKGPFKAHRVISEEVVRINANPHPGSRTGRALDNLQNLFEWTRAHGFHADFPFKIFPDLDTAFFAGRLTENISIVWAVEGILSGGILGATTTDYPGQAHIGLSASAIHLRGGVSTRRMIELTVSTMLHEMCHAYMFVWAGRCEADAHGREFMRMLGAVDQRSVRHFRIEAYDYNETFDIGPRSF